MSGGAYLYNKANDQGNWLISGLGAKRQAPKSLTIMASYRVTRLIIMTILRL